MSLLLDALKKSGQDRKNGETGSRSGTPWTSPEPTPKNKPETPQPKAAQVQAGADHRAAGRNMFAAKAAPARGRMRLGIIPIAVITGLVFAAGGGFYVWYEISAPATFRATAPRPPVPVANPAPPAPAPIAQTPLTLLAEDKHATKEPATVSPDKPQEESAPAYPTAMLDSTATRPTIHIENRQQANTIDPVLEAAYQAYRSGDLTTAWQSYSKVLQQDVKNRDALLGLAAIAQQQGQDDLAARYYDQVLVLNPRDPAAHAGIASLRQDDSSNEETRLKLLLAQQPQSAALYFALGNLYAEQSRWADSQQAYFNAYNLQPDTAQFAFNLAVSLDHLGQARLAAQYYQRALQLDRSGNSGFDRAQAQSRLKDIEGK